MDNKFVKRIKQLNSYWTDNHNLNITSVKETELRPVQLKALINYSFDTELHIEKRFGAEPPSCNSKQECEQKIKDHNTLFLSNQDKEFLNKIPQQAKEREPNLKDKWTAIQRVEKYVEDCKTCKGQGEVHCTACANCSGIPTGETQCFSCFGSGKNSCSSCGGSGEIGEGRCLGCQGCGKKRCFNCQGNGRVTCGTCHGNLKVTCPDCKGHKQFTFVHTLDLNILSETKLSWEKDSAKEWVNFYLEKEISEETTHISIMKYSDWHSHTFNLANFEKEQFFASIQGNIEVFEVNYTINKNEEYECHYIHSTLVPYEMGYIFDNYIDTICENVIEKNSIKFQKDFFDNKIVENIVDEKGEYIPSRSKMIKLTTKDRIKKTFYDFSEAHLEEQSNIDIRDIVNWSGISFITIFIGMFILGLFSSQTIDWSLISFPNIISNIKESFLSIPFFFENYLKESLIFLGFMAGISYGVQKLLGSSKKCILRYIGWFFNLTLINYLVSYNIFPHFNTLEWIFSFNYYSFSFKSILIIIPDIALFSILIGIFKARNINCFKMRKISNLLKNETLNKKLGY